MIHDKLALVVATRDRRPEIRRMLVSLSAQTRKPDKVIIVDGGADIVEDVVMGFPALNPIFLKASFPSASKQRNMGLSAVGDDFAYIGFLDDDVVLAPEAIEHMMEFWEQASERIAGAALNLINHPPLDWPFLKTSRFAEILGLYSLRKGVVMSSGFQTMIGLVQRVTYSAWLPTTAVVWRKRVLDQFRFDEWFDGYSYLEDLDFSYRVGKEFSMAIVPGSFYSHLPGACGRGNGFVFGLREVRNRLHFVRKNPELSGPKCAVALVIRTFMNLVLAIKLGNAYHFQRFLGNIAGLAQAAVSPNREKRGGSLGVLRDEDTRRPERIDP